MVEPPSKPLLETLLELKLCTPRDLRRCRRRVRRLARDVPVFDSVWIDALVQAKKLTPFQARDLETSRRRQLAVGPCVLIDALSRASESRTFLARRRDGNERFVLKLIDQPPEQIDAAQSALDELFHRLRGFAHPSLVVPHSCSRHAGRLVVVSRFVPGPHVGELLVRRGRFPADVIVALGGQLIDGLARLEAFGIAHGDIRLPNIRLTNGAAALVDGGLVPVLAPELEIRPTIAPERYDAVAPELIGMGTAPNAPSDIYALGCVLWHLLAGRPPFPTGDPLAKLAAHQTSSIPDVREWAPDTPTPLAETIRVLTARDPSRRPASFAELRARWPNRQRQARRRLTRFRRMFNTSAPRVPRMAADPAVGKWPALVMVLFVLMGATLSLLDAETAAPLLELRARVASYLTQDANASVADRPAPAATSGLKPLPMPDSDGVLRLDSSGPYEAVDLSWVGPLVIRGTGDAVPEIVISDRPFRVWAEQVTLQNVHLVTDKSQPATAPTLLDVQAQSLSLIDCSFRVTAPAEATAERGTESKAGGSLVTWKALDRHDWTGTLVSLQNTVLLGPASAITLHGSAHRILVANCLKVGAGELFAFDELPAAGQSMRLRLKQTTLRDAGGLARFPAVAASAVGRVQIDAESCVFDLHAEQGALVRFAGERLSPDTVGALEISGDESFVSVGSPVARWLSRDGSAPPLDETAIPVGGLFSSPLTFAGPETGDLRSSELEAFRAPIRTIRTPGVDVARLRSPERNDAGQ